MHASCTAPSSCKLRLNSMPACMEQCSHSFISQEVHISAQTLAALNPPTRPSQDSDCSIS